MRRPALEHLPRDPLEATEQLVNVVIAECNEQECLRQYALESVLGLHRANANNVTQINKSIRDLKLALATIKRTRYTELEENIETLVELFTVFSHGDSNYLKNACYQKLFDDIGNAIDVIMLQDHFYQAEDIEHYDTISLNKDEKERLRQLIELIRQQVSTSTGLSDNHKRRIIHKLAKVENELLKENGLYDSFVACAYEGAQLLKTYGEAVKPLAENIEKIRTTTQRKVIGYEGDEPARITDQTEEVKKLPKPSESETNTQN